MIMYMLCSLYHGTQSVQNVQLTLIQPTFTKFVHTTDLHTHIFEEKQTSTAHTGYALSNAMHCIVGEQERKVGTFACCVETHAHHM